MKRCIACGAPLWETPLLTLDNMPASAQHMPDAEHVGADKELISMAADDINIAEEAFRKYDEHVIEDDPLDHKIHHSFSELYKVPMSDQIFVAQSNVIRRLASHGPCVIVGRCADMILEDSVNIFIYSKMKQRIKRLMELEPEEGINEKDMEMKIRAVDRKRRDYYQYYTGNTWGRAQNYHLCVDSSLVGVDGCLRAALAYLEDVCKDEEKPEDGEKETV